MVVLFNMTAKSLKEIMESYTNDAELTEAIRDFVIMRKEIKKPMTERAMQIMLRKLDKLAKCDADKIAILEQSIFNSWQGIFAVKLERTYSKKQTTADKLDELERNCKSKGIIDIWG